MFANKGRLKVALLFVGVLVAVLGMYASVQVQETYAHNPGGILGHMLHRSDTSHSYKWIDGMTRTMSGTCSFCGSSTTIHQTHVREECWEIKDTYHIDGSYCHSHTIGIKWARYYWRTNSITCSNSNCGG